MERDAEIDKIRHELAILRDRYALYRRWGKVLRVFFMVWVPLFTALVIAALTKLFMADAVVGAFVVGLATLVVLLFWIFVRRPGEPVVKWSQWRWVDAASSWGGGTSLYPGIISPRLIRRSDAQMIEEQIAERERRLAELGEPS